MSAPPETRAAAGPDQGEARLLARVIPPSAIPSSRLRAVLHRDILSAKRWWITLVSGFFEPVFFLFSLGVGLGGLVGGVSWGGAEVS